MLKSAFMRLNRSVRLKNFLGSVLFTRGPKPTMMEDDRQFLREYYKKDVGKLSALLGKDLAGIWNDFS